MKKKLIGVYWGRFNPPHKGHFNLMKKLAKKVDELIIVVGSANKKNTKRNPFSGKERAAMLESVLVQQKLFSKTKVITLNDGKTFVGSVKKLFEKLPKGVVLFADKKQLINAARKLSPQTKIIKTRRTGAISSTRIRKSIVANKQWMHLTLPPVIKLIKEFNGENRIKKAFGTVK